MGHGYEKTGVREVRRILKDDYGVISDEVLKQTKKDLVTLLLQLEQEKGQDEDMENLGYQLEEVEVEDDNILPPQNLNASQDTLEWETPPDFYSPQWAKYVLSLFEPNELINKHPTCDGCRRLVNQLIGPIIESGIAKIIPATHDNLLTATVVFQIKVAPQNENHPLYKKVQVLHIEDVADCHKGNTDAPYNKYLSATASTRAEGRILRKLLGLHTTVAEETSNQADEENWTTNEFISSSQESCINVMCERLNLSVEEFINSGKKTYESIKKIPYNTAIAMIKELTNIQRNL